MQALQYPTELLISLDNVLELRQSTEKQSAMLVNKEDSVNKLQTALL